MSDNHDNDDRMDAPLDLSAWEAEEPSVDFAERVVRRAREASRGDDALAPAATPPCQPRIAQKRVWPWAAAGLAAVAAGALVYQSTRAASEGDATAEGERREVHIGDRAVAVLEPGAKVHWKGNVVEQSQGSVFYRVERGDNFRVHTDAGEVQVLGTCFKVDVLRPKGEDENVSKRDWKMAAAGAASAGLMFVAVYEGKVAVSHAKERVDLTAGQSAITETKGVSRVGPNGEREGPTATQDSALDKANQNLVESVREYKKRLETIEEQKKDLEKRLEVAKTKLDAEERKGDAQVKRNEFDLSQDDLRELAKDGTIKFMSPCSKKDYKPDADTLQRLGLAPQDADVIGAAYKKVRAEAEAQMRPLCQEVLGKSDLTDRIPVEGCMHIVSDMMSEANNQERKAAQQLAADILAGNKPAPGPGDKVPALTRMMLSRSGQAKALERELAKSMGPDEAHRVVFSDELCMGHSTWGGSKK